jgi:hypothetical protein
MDRMREFAANLADGLGKVASKFVQDAVIGIYQAKSVNLTEVAHALNEDIAIHATQKRLSRNLGRADLREAVTQRLLTIAARRVRTETPLYVHVRDLSKRYARKMQYLLPQTSSDSDKSSGYRICEIVASEPGTDRYVPITTHLWSSHAPGFVSDSDEIIATIARVLSATNGRGIIYPSFSVFQHSTTVAQLASIRDMRALIHITPNFSDQWLHRKQLLGLKEAIAACDTPYGMTVYKMHPDGVEDHVFLELGAIQGAHCECPERPGSLCAVRYDSPSLRNTNTEPTLYFSTVPLKNNRATMKLVAACFTASAHTVDANVAHKNRYNLTGFRVLSYGRMQTLLALLQATTFFEAAISRQARIERLSGSLEPQSGDHPRTFLMPEIVNS